MYYCKECLAEVIVIDGEIFRTCEHEEAPIIAEMEAVATGESELN